MVLKEDRSGRLWWGPYNQPKVMVLGQQDSIFTEYNNFNTTNNLYRLWEDEVGNLIFAFSHGFGYTSDFFLLDKVGKVEDWSAIKSYSSICRQIYSRDFRSYLVCGSFRNTFILKQALFGVQSFLKNEDVGGGSLGNNIIRGFSEIDSNTVLVATESDDWYSYNSETNEIITSSIKPKCTYTNLSKSKDVVWFTSCFDGTGNYFYLSRYDKELDEVSKYDCGFSLGSICVDGKEIICVGKKDDNLLMTKFSIDDEKMTPLDMEPAFETPFRFRFYKCYKFGGYYWLGTNNGLYKIKVNHKSLSGQISPTKLSIDNHKVFEIQAISGQLLLSTERGVVVYDPMTEETQIFDQASGLSNNVACATIVSGSQIWVPTFIGLNIVDTTSNTIGLLLETDGIPDDEFNTGAALKTNSGKMYFGTANGMVVVDSAAFRKNGIDFRIGITSYSRMSKKQEVKSYSFSNELLHFKGGESEIYQFKLFSTDDYFYSNSARFFYYTLSNPDEIIPMNGQQLYLSGLPYGKNDLTIFAISKLGFRSNNTIQISIEVSRPFYNAWWFIPLCILLGVLFVGQIVYTLQHTCPK